MDTCEGEEKDKLGEVGRSEAMEGLAGLLVTLSCFIEHPNGIPQSTGLHPVGYGFF